MIVGIRETVATAVIHGQMKRSLTVTPNSSWYYFGSILSDKTSIGDIDLLVVCDRDEDCQRIRLELAPICSRFPIHLQLMTVAEEKEVDFIRTVNAIKVDLGLQPQSSS